MRLAVREGNRTIDEVLDVVAKHYGMTREQLLLMERKRVPYRARHIARYLACCVTRRSLPEIGRATGGVTPTNVLFAKRKVESDMAKDPELAREVEGLKQRLVSK
jgi:chromosomal replication initiator protein